MAAGQGQSGKDCLLSLTDGALDDPATGDGRAGDDGGRAWDPSGEMPGLLMNR